MILCGLLVSVALAAAERPTPRTVTYKTVAGHAIEADLYHPGGAVRPLIFFIHGGALIMGNRGGIRTGQLTRYLDAGYAVVSIDYRLAPETKLPEILADVRDAWNWTRTHGRELGIDPKRIAVIGHSAGGYLTLTCGYRLKPRPRALVAFYGYGDIAADWYAKPDPFYSSQPAVPKDDAYAAVQKSGTITSPPAQNQRGRFYLYLRQHGLWNQEVAGLDPATQNAAFTPYSPARNVTRAFPPTLLLHGDKDTDVPFSQSEQMDRELAKAGVEHEFIRIAGGGHGFDGREADPQVQPAFEKVLAFLRSHLQ